MLKRYKTTVRNLTNDTGRGNWPFESLEMLETFEESYKMCRSFCENWYGL